MNDLKIISYGQMFSQIGLVLLIIFIALRFYLSAKQKSKAKLPYNEENGADEAFTSKDDNYEKQ